MTMPRHSSTVEPDCTPAVAVPETAIAATPAEVLQSDEIIQLSIKPSLWFIPLVSMKVVLATALLAATLALGAKGAWNMGTSLAFNGVVGIAVLRLAFATLQWASRLYVLTNRRVLRFRGVFTVSVGECRLSRIAQADLRISTYQRWLGLGSIRMTPIDDRAPAIDWDQVAAPQEIHEIVAKAITRAQSGD